MSLLNRFFKKAEQPIVAPANHSYPAEVYEIHHAFETAGDSILAEAQAVLKECEGKSVEKGKRLIGLGFKQATEARMVSDILSKEANAKEVSELVLYYRVNYPNNKFITETQVKAICEKWGLVCGPAERYKGFVPEKNLTQIETFKLKKQDSDLEECVETCLLNISLGYFKNANCEYSYLIANGQNDGRISNEIYNKLMNKAISMGADREKVFVQKSGTKGRPELKICAPLKDMDSIGMNLHGYKLEKHIPDPVVLQPVNGGYLIVTAWGDEASDENVVNEAMN